MDGGEKRDHAAPPTEGRPVERLPYERPSVVWEQPLEAQPSLMSGCDKIPLDVACQVGIVSS